MDEKNMTGLEIAVIGMAARYPGAEDIHQYWKKLKEGTECISFFSRDELLEAGVPAAQLDNPNYINACGFLENTDSFDASFFGYTPKEAEIMDPQIRLFHECVWTALENAGYEPGTYKGLIGLYAGASAPTGWHARAIISGKVDEIGAYAAQQLIQREYLTLRISYKLNLTGPSFEINTACSTSLVAIHVACQSILNGECHMALAGGVTITRLEKTGYMFQTGMIHASDGHCRAFDADADGTVGADGAGVVLLKRLEDAVEDRDHIYAVIKGSAINNDGFRKAGFNASSVEGQAEAIKMALQMAEVEPESITYVEAHGTGTKLGDPVEIEALKLAFDTGEKNYCAVGSAKSNLGHTNCAAGAAGFIKTVMALHHRLIPPSLHYKKPNPGIDFENSPFYVNAQPTPWNNKNQPLRAGVSSFGMGGTNAHVILEEWPRKVAAPGPANSDDYHFIMLSAKSEYSLEKATQNLAGHFKQNPGTHLPDAAYTLQVGRKAFSHRRMLLCSTLARASEALSAPDGGTMQTYAAPESEKNVVFMFSGQGSQYIDMGRDLYRTQPIVRAEMDRCFQILTPILGSNLKDIIYPAAPSAGDKEQPRINQTQYAQPALFIIEYALAKLLIHWGIKPYAMLGHSIGEYAAACISGVFTLEDALKLVAFRGRAMQKMHPGDMISVSLTPEQIQPYLNEDISVAAVNTPASCVLSGPHQAVEALSARLKQDGHNSKPLHTSHAFHSKMMEPMMAQFEAEVKKITLNKPEIPYVSNLTGQWITPAQAADPRYWSAHLRGTVLFAQSVGQLLDRKDTLFVEVGPGRTLASFVSQHPARSPELFAANLVRHPKEKIADNYYLLNKIGQLWLYGQNIDWTNFYDRESRYRLPLPTYCFDRQRYWIEMPRAAKPRDAASNVQQPETRTADSSPHQSETPAAAPSPAVEKTSPLYPRPNLLNPYVAPSNPAQESIAAIWCNLLGFEKIGVRDNFLDLGGDSMKAVTVTARIHKELNVEIPMTEFFNRLTVEELSQYVTGQQDHQPAYSRIPPAPQQDNYPLSSAQKRLYIVQQIDRKSTGYNETQTMVLPAGLSREKLQATFHKMLRRHEILRTSIRLVEGEALQHVHPAEEIDFDIEYSDLSSVETYETVAPARDKIEEIVRAFVRPFDMAEAPLMRAALIKINSELQVLVIDTHHIITDGTSSRIFREDFTALFQDRELPPLTLHYKDYSQWQQSPDGKEKLREQEAFWLTEFEGEIPVLNLPTDYPRPPLQRFDGGELHFEIGGEETRALKELAAAHGSTLFMMLMTLYNIFLAKISGRDDIVVGTPTAGRNHQELDNILGMFINTLPLRNYPSGQKTCAHFLAEVAERTLKAFENQQYQFEDLVEKLPLERDAGRNPLFDVMLVMTATQDTRPASLFQEEEQAPDTPGNPDNTPEDNHYYYGRKTSKFDLTLMAWESRAKLYFNFIYASKLFKEETLSNYIRYFKNIVAAACLTPQQEISRMELLTEGEKSELLSRFNDTRAPYPEDQTIHRLFEQRVEKNRHAAAVSGPSLAAGLPLTLSANCLNSDARHLADRLGKSGVTPRSIVAVMLPPTVEIPIAILAVLKAGAAYLPIEPGYPVERKNYMLTDSCAAALLTTRSLAAGITFDKEIIYLDEPYHSTESTESTESMETTETEAQALKSEESSPVTSSDLVYVIYTSGTSGKPKGVMLKHRNLVNYSTWLSREARLSSRDRSLLTSSYAFDLGYTSIYPALLNSVPLHIIPGSLYLSGRELLRYIAACQITYLKVTPSLFSIILHSPDFAAPSAPLRNLRLVVMGGEAINSEDVENAYRQYPHLKIINHYGPTEATIGCIAQYIDFQDFEAYKARPTIGKPIANSEAYILDAHFNLQPAGVPGQLCIAGDCLARGYLNRPQLTTEKFASLPQLNDKRVYQTGDMARYTSDDRIEFLGRIDHQIKIRGFRVETGEIENHLLNLDYIKEAVVIVRQEESGDNTLVAYVVPTRNLESGELRNTLADSLPDYMIPSYFVPLDAIPLTANGKVNRKALPDPELDDTVQYVAPEDSVEEKLVEIWADVLGREKDKISTRANLFEIGGHSLKTTVILTKIHKEFEVEISLGDIFRTPTVKAIAALIKTIDWAEDANTGESRTNDETAGDTDTDNQDIMEITI